MDQIIGKHTVIITAQPRKAFVAFIFSLVTPGLGQIYNGQVRKAITFFSLLLLFPLFFGLIRGTTCFYGLVSFYVIDTTLRIYIVFDSIVNAIRQKEYRRKPYNTWYHYLLIAIVIFVVLIFYNVNKMLGTQKINILTVANYPTLQVGDRFVADMRAYDNNQPDYGDIVVFTDPDGDTCIFRIVGLPNDNVEIVDNIISVNSIPSKAIFIKEFTDEGVPILEFEEELPNGRKHLIFKLKYPYDSTKSNIQSIVVPPDSYYLLGDNRDNAADSRYIGFINKKDIKGRIIYNCWGQTKDRINIDLRSK